MVLIRILLIILSFVPVWAQQRVVSLAPSLTEIVCAIGGESRLVGVTDYCLYPLSVTKLAKVGGYINPNLERILSLEPDLVLAAPEHLDTVTKLKTLGIETATIRNWDLADIYKCMEDVGRLLKLEAEAAALGKELKKRQDLLSTKVDKPKRVLLALGHSGEVGVIKEVYLVGNNGFLNELLDLAGGINVWKKKKPHFPKVSQEALLELDPDVIIELVPEDNVTELKLDQRKRAWLAIPFLKAAQAGRYHVIHGVHVLQPGPRYLETLEQFKTILEQP